MSATQTQGKVIFAKDAVIGQEYQCVKGKPNTVMIGSQGQDGKTALLVKIPGYNYKTVTPLKVEGSFLLRELPHTGEKNMPKKKAAPTKSKSSPAASTNGHSTSKVTANGLTKIPAGKAAPRVKLEGFNLREAYRSHLSELRAKDCEAAHKNSCACRCGGALHGRSHKAWFEKEAKLFAEAKGGYLTAKQVLALIKGFGGKPPEVRKTERIVAAHKKLNPSSKKS